MKRFLFGGKGGVGKTTISAAFAIFLARHYNTLLISTDPTHSLSDIFEVQLGNKEVLIPLTDQFEGQLRAVELNPQQAILQYKEQTLARVRKLGLQLDFDVEKYIDTVTAAPGAQESAIFDQFAEQLARNDVEAMIFDTAPTGTTLQMLQMSNLINRWINTIVRSRAGLLKLRKMYHEQSDDAVLAELIRMKKSFKRIRKLLIHRDTHLIFIVTPEKLSFDETKRAVKFLKKNKLKISGIVVNRILPDDKIFFNGLKEIQQLYLEKIRNEWSGMIMIELPWWHTMPQGFSELHQLAEYFTTIKLELP